VYDLADGMGGGRPDVGDGGGGQYDALANARAQATAGVEWAGAQPFLRLPFGQAWR